MDLLTVQETAVLLKLNPKTVRNYIASGRLAARRVGRRVRIERTAAEALAVPFRPLAPDAAKPTNGSRQAAAEVTSGGG